MTDSNQPLSNEDVEKNNKSERTPAENQLHLAAVAASSKEDKKPSIAYSSQHREETISTEAEKDEEERDNKIIEAHEDFSSNTTSNSLITNENHVKQLEPAHPITPASSSQPSPHSDSSIPAKEITHTTPFSDDDEDEDEDNDDDDDNSNDSAPSPKRLKIDEQSLSVTDIYVPPKPSQENSNNINSSASVSNIVTSIAIDPPPASTTPSCSLTDKYESMQPRLKKFLKIYQLSARNTINGPPSQNEIQQATTVDEPVFSGSNTVSVNSESSRGHKIHEATDSLALIANVAVAAAEAAAAVQQPRKQPAAVDEGRFHSHHNHHQQHPNHDVESGATAAEKRDHHHGSSHHHHHHHHHHHKKSKHFIAAQHQQKQQQSAAIITRCSSKDAPPRHASYLKCIQMDTGTSDLMETQLYSERISCFVVGGEKRLCLHDILNTILRDFSVQQINNACQKLQITCLESTSRQLEILKRMHLLPVGAPNCGLLTQSNAERLCAWLLDSQLSAMPPTPPPSTSPPSSHLSGTNGQQPHTFKVVHECFGKTYGRVHATLYVKPDAACVECDSCHRLYTPRNFVCHTHKYETHTRHWGFDSANWRVYLKLAANQSSSSSGVESGSVLTDKSNFEKNATQATHEDFELFKKKFLSGSSHVVQPQPQLPPKNTTKPKTVNKIFMHSNQCGTL